MLLCGTPRSETFAPCANRAVARRYGGRKTNVAISHAIANSALSTGGQCHGRDTGTICDLRPTTG